MRTIEHWQRLVVYTAEPPSRGRPTTLTALLAQAATAGIAGATVLAGSGGYGRHHTHQSTLLHGADKTPLVLVIVDEPDRIRAFLPRLRELLPDAVATVDDVEAIRYQRSSPDRAGPIRRPRWPHRR